MSCYRRIFRPGGTYFFVTCLAEHGQTHLTDHIDALRSAYVATQLQHPFQCDAMTVLPDRILAVWTMPPGDADYASRWQKIKTRFTFATGLRGPTSPSKMRKREAGLWQRRFWEHTIRDVEDFHSHIAQCHAAPVAMGLCSQPDDWPHSSLHRDNRLAAKRRQRAEMSFAAGSVVQTAELRSYS